MTRPGSEVRPKKRARLTDPDWSESWLGRRTANRKVAGSIPGQGTHLGCGPGPQLGAHERPLIDVSLPFSLLSPLKINE